MEASIMQPNDTASSLLASPASTETEIKCTTISKNNVKEVIVRDYAYPSSFPSLTPPCLRPIPEIFNQYEGLAEVDY